MILVRTPWTTRRYPTAVTFLPHGDVTDLLDESGSIVATVRGESIIEKLPQAEAPSTARRLRDLLQGTP